MSGDWQRESATPRAQRCKFTQQRRNRVIMKQTDTLAKKTQNNKLLFFGYTVMDYLVWAIFQVSIVLAVFLT